MRLVEPNLPLRARENCSVAGSFEIAMVRLLVRRSVYDHGLLAIAEGVCKIVRLGERKVAQTKFVPQKTAVRAHELYLRGAIGAFSRPRRSEGPSHV